MEWIKLIGVLIIVIGFAIKFDTIATVIIAGVVTGLVSGLSFSEILAIIGSSFVSSRYMSLFLLTLLVIGLLERYGLRERAAYLINKLKSATAGGILMAYTGIRLLAAAFSLRLGGHVQFIRPLVYPMAEGGAENKHGDLTPESKEEIKGFAAAAENYGNFFGQNVFIGAGGVLLIVGTLAEQGIQVTPAEVSKWSIVIAVAAFVISLIQYFLMDRKIAAIEAANQKGKKEGK